MEKKLVKNERLAARLLRTRDDRVKIIERKLPNWKPGLWPPPPPPSLWPTQVTSPDPADPRSAFDYNWTNDGHFQLIVAFSGPVRFDTIVSQKTVMLRFSQDSNAKAKIDRSIDDTSIRITTEKTAEQLLTPDPDDSFSLLLVCNSIVISGGITKVGITDYQGRLVDGDYDGNPGGNFINYYTIIG